jgi:UDP-N-acetylmuramoylalanine--D-glutamate ligase
LGGNIGNPILNLNKVSNSFVVIEASSFQLSHSKFIQPDYAFFLNLKNDHLDWHGNMNKYLNAKLKIFEIQNKNQYAVINKSIKTIFKKRKFLGKPIFPELKKYKKIKSKINNKYLTSGINDENMNFVYTFSKLVNIRDESFINSMQSFNGLPHRFEIFMKKKGITFINDSKATSFTAANLAISSLKNIFWILGGLPKQGDKIELSKLKKNIIKSYIIGKNVNFFKNQIKGKILYSISKNLENAIRQIFKDYKYFNINNCNILLSPAAASFDQFDNFEIRGNKFKKLCKVYARKLI